MDGQGNIRKRWTAYCSNLYEDKDESNIQLLDDLQKITPPPLDDENDNIMYEEVEKAIKQLKRNKCSRADEIKG